MGVLSADGDLVSQSVLYFKDEIWRVPKESDLSCLSLGKAKWKLGRDSLAGRSNRTIRIW